MSEYEYPPPGLVLMRLAQEGWLAPFEAEELRALNAGFVRDVLAVKKELLATQAARDALAAELDAAQARADSLEAQCAAMRGVIEDVKAAFKSGHYKADTLGLDIARALQSDAGRGYVRAEQLREALGRAVRDLKWVDARLWVDVDEDRINDCRERVESALSALALLDTLLAESEGAG